jgi:predicted phage tail protein
MNTDIEYLHQLETDLKDAAALETARMERVTLQGAIRRRTGRTWTRVVGVAAAFLVVAGAIGFVASGGSIDGAGSEAAPASLSRHAVGGEGEAASGNPQASQAPTTAPDTGEAGFLGDEDQRFGVRHGTAANQQRDLSKIVRDGRIGLVVPDGSFGDAVGDLTFIAERHGGFILSSSTNNDRSGTFVLRIPAKRFDRALGDIRDLATHVRFQEVRGEDVTAEFIDQHARLRILQGRKTLLSNLSQQANTTEEILRLGSQLDDVQLRIEQIQGQIRFINDQVAESTLRVSIQERNAPAAATPNEVDNPDLGSSVDLAVQGFLRIVGAVIVGLGYLIPLTGLGAVVWFGVWFVMRRRAIS